MISLQQIEAILKRARTLKRLYFYQNKIVSCYLLASHGFMKKQNGLISCQTCNKEIKLDSPNHPSEIRQSFNLALTNHNSSCQILPTIKLIHNIQLQSIIYHHAEGLVDGIRKTFAQYDSIIKISNKDWLNTIQSHPIYLALYETLDEQFQTREFVKCDVLLSAFGWKRIQQSLLECIYCGNTNNIQNYKHHTKLSYVKNTDGFSFYYEHRPSCLIRQSEFWQKIIKKLVSVKLNGVKGELEKTEEQIMAKQLRKNLQNVGKNLNPRLQIIQTHIRQNLEEVDKQDELSIKKKRCLEKAHSLINQFKETVQVIVKKIRIN